MGADVGRVIVVDVEATCWATREEQGSLPNEIIEIGACALNIYTGEITDNVSIVVKPSMTKITPFCTALTGWTQEAVDAGGMAIQVAMDAFRDTFKPTKETIWASFGEYDRWKLSSSHPAGVGKLYRLDRATNPFELMRSHINVKTLMALRFKLKKEMGMGLALSHVGETLEGRHHHGADDAYNIAKILRKVLA